MNQPRLAFLDGVRGLTLLHLVGYVGAPAARDALQVAARIFAEMRA